MAAVSVTNDNTSVEDFETALPTLFDTGTGKASALETVTYFEGSQSLSRKTTSDPAGTGFSATGVDLSGGEVVMAKILLTDYQDVTSTGWGLRLGSSSANLYRYLLLDDGTLGDRGIDQVGFARGGWGVMAIEPSNLDWFDVLDGSAPTLTAITHWQNYHGLATGGAKSENAFLDAVDYTTTGLFLVGGDGADADGVWQDYVDHDQGTAANRFGHALTNASGIELRGKFVRGRTNAAGAGTTATVFTDALKSLTWVGGRVSAGWNELEDDLTNGTTAITETNSTFRGAGRDNLKRYFDTDHEVNATDDVIEIVAHGFKTGDAVLYTNEGGTETPGPTNNTRYFVNRDTGTGRDADGFSLHSSRANAYANTSPLALTASTSGNGENHSLRRQPDTRPDYTATSNTGSSTYTGCNFVRFRVFTLTSGATLDTCTIVGCDSITLGGGTVDTCSISEMTTTEGEAFMTGTRTEIENVSSCTITAGVTGGHAYECTGTAGTLNMSANTHIGFGPDPELGDGHSFDTITGVDATNDEIDYTTHAFSTGDPVYYSRRDPTDGSLGTDAIGMADGDLVYVRSVTANAFSLHPTRYAAENNLDKIGLTDGSTGETHTFYSADAAFVNNTGGAITLNVTGGTAPSVRNVGASTTNVVVSVTVTITVNDVGGNPVQNASVYVQNDAGPFNDTDHIIRELTNASGVATEGYGGSTPLDVVVRVRKKGFKPFDGSGQIQSGTGLSVTVRFEADPNQE